MSDYPRKCIFCHERAERLVKVGVRHYAHTKCIVEKRGEDWLLSLPVGALSAVEIFQISAKARETILARFAP